MAVVPHMNEPAVSALPQRLLQTGGFAQGAAAKYIGAAILAALPLTAALVIVRPFGNVLYGGDDWSYAWSVRTLVNTGRLEISDWSSAAAVPQILLGAVFVRVLGWSASALNASTATIAVLGAFAFFYLLIELGFDFKLAVAATVVVTTTPLYLGMAGSFMSDSMYTTLMLAASAAYARALRLSSRSAALAGSLLCCGAVLNRQIGVALVVAYGVVIGWMLAERSSGSGRRLALHLAAWGLALPLVVLVSYQLRPELYGGRSVAQSLTLDQSAMLRSLMSVPINFIKCVITYEYVVVMLLPLLLPLIAVNPTLWRQLSGTRRLLLTTIVLAHTLWFWRTGGFRVAGDLLHVSPGVGNDGPWVPTVWTAVVGLSIIPGAIILAAVADALRSTLRLVKGRKGFLRLPLPGRDEYLSTPRLFVVILLVGHVILTTGFPAFYNNYFLPLLPLASVCAFFLLEDLEFRPAFAAAMVAAWMTMSVLYIESHARFVEANWNTADALVRSGHDARRIFAWPSWYGWNQYDAIVGDLRASVARGEGIEAVRVFRRLLQSADLYVCGSTRNDRTGWPSVDSVRYRTLLGDRELYVLRRGPRTDGR